MSATTRARLIPRPDAVPGDDVAIRATGFSFWYGQHQVLHDITIAIPRQDITAIIGPSGCGKSTFLRSMNRMDALAAGSRTSGDLLIDGMAVHATDTDLVSHRQRVGMVFQRPNPFPKSIYRNVAYGPTLNKLVPPRDIPDLVERSLRGAALWNEVADRLDQPALALSGGQQQRLCIARALANSPDVLLMDEPCSALDPIATARIEELILELRQDFTIVIVTHNLQQAGRVATNTAFFEAGRLIEFDRTERMFTSPARERTEAYITGRFG